MFVLPCAIVALLSLYLSFLHFGLLVRTRSRSYGLCHRLYTLARIKGFGLPHLHVYTCLLLCFMLMLASLVLDFATFDTHSGFVVVWLHPTPIRPCSDVAIWGCISVMPVASCIPLFFRSVLWYACHACLCYLLAFYTSLHACIHVHAWVLLASVSSILQHNEAMDIRSKPTFVPCGHYLLFVSLLVAFLSCLFAISFACFPASLFLCLPYLSCLFALRPLAIIYAFSFHCLSAGFSISAPRLRPSVDR